MKLPSAILIFLVLIVNLTVTASASDEAITAEQKAAVLNLAGKQRMLTQKITKDILHIRREMEDLNKNIKEFEQTLNGLLQGDEKRNLPKTQDPEIVKQLNQVVQLWQPFREEVKAILTGDSSSARVHNVVQQNMPLMEHMNLAVEMYEKAFFDTLEPGMATTLNLAGKQRMLTQKMGKEVQLVLRNIKPEENSAYLKETMSLFDRTLKGLIEGDSELGLPGTKPDTPIYKQLITVDKIWKAYQPLLNDIIINHQHSDKEEQEAHIAEARRINLHLLINMHRVVNMYEKATGLRLSSLRSRNKAP